MTDRASYDLDAALAALARDEHAARPAVHDNLKARVLADAAETAAKSAAGRAAASAPERARAQRLARPRTALVRLFGLPDLWSGASVATVMLCLMLGLGVGYVAGPEVLAQAGLDGSELAFAAEDRDAMFLAEDVL